MLSLIHEEANKLLDLLVDTFSLAVSLWVVGNTVVEVATLIMRTVLSPHMKFDTNWMPQSLITVSRHCPETRWW